ncbi:MAG: hypothetical protein JJU02_15285 [Cryomorphaceae bacterium]|nr:hypothetical protein [Cryomorphaceae bacterium]
MNINGFAQKKDSLEYTKFYHENGKVSSEGTLRNGVPDGYWKSYHINGNIKSEGNRLDEKLDSLWKFYTEDGVLFVSITYKDGVKNGPRITYKDGVKTKKEIFIEDKLEGNTEFYFTDGSVSKRIPFENGRENGLGFEYDTAGTIVTLLTFKTGVLTKKRQINRYDQSGKKISTWMEFHPNMRIKWEGSYTDDLKHGYFKYYTSKGDLIKTERWIMGVLQEPDSDTEKLEIRKQINPETGKISHVGSYLQGKKEGVHRAYDDDGNVIGGGIYSAGFLLAEGITDDQGRRQKHWKFYYQTGELKEEGGYRDGKKHGKWTYYFMNGKVEQEGRFSNDRPVDLWVWYHSNGEVWREAEYMNGFLDGNFIEKDSLGNTLAKGKFVEGFRDGDWFYQVGSVRRIGKYFDGERTGEWIHYYTVNDEVRFKGSYINGMPEGRHTWYYDNGQVEIRGIYRGGRKEGIWEFFNRTGIRYLTITYENDEEVEYNGSKISYGKRYDKRLEEAEQ